MKYTDPNPNLHPNPLIVVVQGGGSRVSSMKQYAVQHELLTWFEKKGGKRTYNAQECVEHYKDEDRAVALAKGSGRVSNHSLDRGRPPRSFVDISRENSKSKERSYGVHPSMKPLKLCDHLLKLHTSTGDKVFIPFAGSGSELLSASKLERDVEGAEVSNEYVQMIKKRFHGHGVRIDVQ